MNPASPGLPPVDNVFGRNGIVGNGASAMCVSCHTTVPIPGYTSHFISHYSSAAGGVLTTTPANQSAKERMAAWNGSGFSSKYGKNLATAPASDNTVRGELICESCHSLLRNVAGGNNLLESSRIEDTRDPGAAQDAPEFITLCEGCHYPGSLPGKHPMSSDPILRPPVDPPRTLSTTDTLFTRGYVSPGTEMGGAGSGVFYPGQNRLPCLSCHANGHTGHTGTGARILRRGWSHDAVTPGALGSGVRGADTTGIARQFDVDPAGANRLITHPDPLCDACHKTND